MTETTCEQEMPPKSRSPTPTPVQQGEQPASGLPVISMNLSYLRDINIYKIASTFTAAEEDDDFFDADSAYGALSYATDTASLNSSIMKFRQENGRTYHSYGMSDLAQSE